MRTHHVVADSDDSSSELSEVDSQSPERPLASLQLQQSSSFIATPGNAPATSSATASATTSTDPELFARVYAEQLDLAQAYDADGQVEAATTTAVTEGVGVAIHFSASCTTPTTSGDRMTTTATTGTTSEAASSSLIPDCGVSEQPQLQSLLQQQTAVSGVTNTSSLTNITSPATRRGRKRKFAAGSDDMTQITTPRTSMTGAASGEGEVGDGGEAQTMVEDPWAVPASPQQLSTRPGAKRKRGGDTTAEGGEEGAMKELELETPSILSNSGGRQAEDGVSDKSPTQSKRAKRQKRGSNTTRRAEICIPMTIAHPDLPTALDDGTAGDPSQLVVPSRERHERSSGTTTVAMPTPPEFTPGRRSGKSSGREPPGSSEASVAETQRTRKIRHQTSASRDHVPSSPDIITMSQPEQWHSARGRRSGDVEENHQTDQFIGQNDEDNENEPVPKANRRASNKNVKKAAKIVVLDDSDEEELLDDDGHVSDSEDDDDDSDESPPPKKTKARVPEKRDRGKVVAPVPVPAAPAAAKDENVAPADKPKTGRGRPRKKGTGVGATTGRQDDAPKVPDPTIAGSLDGGKAVAVLKESDPNISGRPRPTTAGPIEKAAGCVTQNDQKTAAAATGDEAKQDASKAKTTTEASKKPPAPSSQPGRVVYRVGLSKTSRIAPLLKIIRK